jgi:recombination protein RecT
MTTTDIISLVYDQKPQFMAVRSDPTLDFDREAQFATQIILGNDYMMGVARANPQSVSNAVNNVAAIGISLNPASKLAYLVPRKKSVCLDISYMGLLHIAQQSGAIDWGQAVIVRALDTFELQGIDSPPLHKFNPFATDRGEIVGVYVVVKTDTGDYLTHGMPIAKVYDIRNRSESWKAFERDSTKKGPWNTDEEEMVKKTCVKQAAKYWPRRERLDSAVHHLNTEGGEGLLQPNKMDSSECDDWILKIKATTTSQDAKNVWEDAKRACLLVEDVESANTIKAALVAHLNPMKSAKKAVET